MLFDQSDIETLRLVGWCKNFPAASAGMSGFSTSITSTDTNRLLCACKLLSAASSGIFYRLSPGGYQLLRSLGFDYPRDKKYISDQSTLTRRLQSAKILMTFFRAGYDVFGGKLSQLAYPNHYLTSMAIRRETAAFGGTRFLGIARNEELAYMAYFVGDGDGGVFLTLESNLFYRATQNSGCNREFLFFGDSYEAIISQISDNSEKHNSKTISYSEMYRRTSLPIHFVECNDAGAVQLLLMGLPNARYRIARLVFPDCGPPSQSAGPIDAVTARGRPVVIGIDMQAKRLRQAVRLHPEAMIIVLTNQLPVIARLCAPRRPELYGVDGFKLLELLNLKLTEPPREPYRNSKGEVICVSDLP